MSTQKQIDRLIAQRASEWVETLKTAGPAEHEAFVDWLRESRRHVAEFLTMVALEREMEGVDLHDVADREALLARLSPRVTQIGTAAQAARQTLAGPATPRGKTLSRRWRFVATAAGIATVTLISMHFLNKPAARQEFAATVDEQRAIELTDGSVVQLNAGSRVTTRLTSIARELELVKGEALFKVARDAHRPFRVRTGSTVVEALGTEFNINALPSGTVVSIVEGKVRISSEKTPASARTLSAGEGVLIDSTGFVRRDGAVDVDGAIAWRQRRLVFQKTPLEEVVRQFNSHNAAPKLRLEGIEPGSRHYSATFDVDDPESFGDYLSREPDLTIGRQGEEIVIRRRY